MMLVLYIIYLIYTPIYLICIQEMGSVVPGMLYTWNKLYKLFYCSSTRSIYRRYLNPTVFQSVTSS